MLAGITILYLDNDVAGNDAAPLSWVATRIESHGARVVSTRRADAALARLHGGLRPELILCGLTAHDSLDFQRQLREAPAWRSIPFVSITASTDEAYRRAMNAGADGCLPRPFGERQLVLELNHVLRRQEELRTALGVSITLLGAQQVRRGGELLRAPDRGAEQLVFYLLLEPLFSAEPCRSRQEIIGQLWEDISPSGFRSVLTRARRWSKGWSAWRIGPDALELTLSTEANCDIYTLHSALARDVSGERLERLYGGPLLPAYQDDWALAWREQLGERVKKAFLRDAAATHREEERLQSLRRALAADPLDFELRQRYITGLERADLHIEARRAREKLKRQL